MVSNNMTIFQSGVQGNCTSFPGSSVVVGLSLQDLQEHWDLPKCLIISRTDFFIVIAPIWIDSLYLRRRPAAYYPFTFIYSTGAAAALYATNVTVQDNGPNNSTVIWSGESSQAVFAGADSHPIIEYSQLLHVKTRHIAILSAIRGES